MSLKQRLQTSVNEKDVENVYRSEFSKHIQNLSITSPHKVDGLMEFDTVKTLLEFKYDDVLKNKLSQCNVLIQCLYYLKKFELNGEKLPSTIFVGDKNECFCLHTNSIVKYLSTEINWKIAPSEAHKKNPELIQAMVNDVDILQYVFDVNEKFHIKEVISKIKDLSDNIVYKVRITQHNVVTIFEYFDKHILTKSKLSTNEKANLFIQIIINPENNYIHPKKKDTLSTKSYGDISISTDLFNSFFKHFEGDVYSPKEKEQLTSLVDRLVEDTTRRKKGEFFTPTPFVDLAHKYISDTFGEDWKEKYIVYDCAWGTGNLTRDYQFQNLFVSTLEQSDIDTANQMGYNMNATKFQFDFLNDQLFDNAFGKSKVPTELQEAIKSGREILFLINPPYATAGFNGEKEGCAINLTNTEMKDENWGESCRNLYTQFLYRIHKIQERNKNVKIGVFCPPLFLTGSTFQSFRAKFFKNFGFETGFLFEATHFSDVSKGWGILFSLFGNNATDTDFSVDVVDFENFELRKTNQKKLFNLDGKTESAEWIRHTNKGKKLISTIQLKSAINPGQSNENKIVENSLGYLIIKSNRVKSNVQEVVFLSSASSNRGGVSIDIDNFLKGAILFTSRKLIQSNWINCNDEYIAPTTEVMNSDLFKQFQNDSIVYSLFNTSSQQSSLRQVEYKNKLWDIKNEFFWLSREQMMDLAEQNNYDNLYKDAKNGQDRYVYKTLQNTQLSPDAIEILELATELLIKSIPMRKLLSSTHPEYHLDTFDAGFAQLKLVWKEYFKDELKVFRDKYKLFENRMRPLVYELGFLRK